ncbi:MAG TPA: hypothetical protein VJ767_12620 [Nitrososphaeraceae archaeon]|nr:hypothetical protein [Nitrososphaeraceae archaeon]
MIDIYFKHRTEKEGEKLTDDLPFIRHRTNSLWSENEGILLFKGTSKNAGTPEI